MTNVIDNVFGCIHNPVTNELDIVRRFTLTNDTTNSSVQVITLGATITTFCIPDKNGKREDIVLGYDDVPGYQLPENPYFGATIGRVCNRIANGRFTFNGKEIELKINNGNNHLHGGIIGFDKVVWNVEAIHEDGVTFSHLSPDGYEGYPGEVFTTVRYTLTNENSLHIKMEAESKAPTVINLTNHSYFNLAGHSAGMEELYSHTLEINANTITETNDESVPTGNFIDVADGAYDFREPVALSERFQQLPPDAKGFDDNFCVERGDADEDTVTKVARAFHPQSGRWLEIFSNQPGVQFYTANYFPDVENNEPPMVGKNKANYVKQCAFCLETQKYPDAVNHPEFPSIVLKPGTKYNHEIIYKYGVGA